MRINLLLAEALAAREERAGSASIRRLWRDRLIAPRRLAKPRQSSVKSHEDPEFRHLAVASAPRGQQADSIAVIFILSAAAR
jgi:hypothetical protein